MRSIVSYVLDERTAQEIFTPNSIGLHDFYVAQQCLNKAQLEQNSERVGSP